jgi:hypothetical protein
VAAFGGGALLASSMSKRGNETRPTVRVDRQGAVPVSRVAFPDSSQPALSSGTTEPVTELHSVAEASQAQPRFEGHAIEDRPKSRRELRAERRRLRDERRAERREKRHLRDVRQQSAGPQASVALDPQRDAFSR